VGLKVGPGVVHQVVAIVSVVAEGGRSAV
jgi:hypothetical protein